MKFKTNLNAFKPKYNAIIKEKDIKIIHKNEKKKNNEKVNKEQNDVKIIKIEKEGIKTKEQKDEKESNDKNTININKVSKEQKLEKNDKFEEKKEEKENGNINIEENSEHRNLIKHREKKVHYEKKIKKKIIHNKDHRINSEKVQYSKVKKIVKNKNDIENVKPSFNYKNIKIKRHMKSQSIYLEEENNFKRHKIKYKVYKTPIKENKKLGINSKLFKPLDKTKVYELTERIEKKERILNQTGDTFPKVNKDIVLSENISQK